MISAKVEVIRQVVYKVQFADFPFHDPYKMEIIPELGREEANGGSRGRRRTIAAGTVRMRRDVFFIIYKGE